jgi:serine protease Do
MGRYCHGRIYQKRKKEEVMKRDSIQKSVMYVMLLAAAVFSISGTGCETKGKEEFIGFPKSFADLAEKVRPAVVNISTISTVKVPGNPFKQFFGQGGNQPFGDFFRHFFGDIPDRELKQQSLGSGFIVDKDGFIITNNHVVAGADEIKVKLSDGREFKAKVVGRDPKTDLALIKISSLFSDLPVLVLGDSDSMRVGDWVIAIGNPFGLEHTVTQGIISARGRTLGAGPYDNFLQTDAPINPGNSGGPLVNLKGEVIGINSAIIAGGQGIGFAIPSKMAKSIIPQLKEKGKVVRGWIGISIQTVTPEIAKAFNLKEPEGALVGDVVQGGPADKGGIKRGDIIISFDGRQVKHANDLPAIVADTQVGKSVDVKVLREGKEISTKITVAEMTEQRLASQMATPHESLGMKVDEITPKWEKILGLKDKTGVVVVDVTSGSPAAYAGIQPSDIIKEVNHKPVRNLADYDNAMKEMPSDRPVLFLIRRGGVTFFVSLGVS